MTSHFDRHRGDVRDLVDLAERRGVTLTEERAYRAWIRHSRSMEAGFSGFSLEGEGADIAFAILTGELPGLAEQDAGFLDARGDDVALLHGYSEEAGLGLPREEAAAIWADHSAAHGKDWLPVGDGDLDAVLGPHRREASPGRSRW